MGAVSTNDDIPVQFKLFTFITGVFYTPGVNNECVNLLSCHPCTHRQLPPGKHCPIRFPSRKCRPARSSSATSICNSEKQPLFGSSEIKRFTALFACSGNPFGREIHTAYLRQIVPKQQSARLIVPSLLPLPASACDANITRDDL